MNAEVARLGAYSEVGKLRMVMVSSPGLAHQRYSRVRALASGTASWAPVARLILFP